MNTRICRIVFMISLIIIFISCGYSQVKFAIIGDYGDQASDSSQAVADMVNSWGVDFILSLGENTTTGDIDADVGKYYHQWIKPYTGSYGPGSADINRFFPTIGNHDYYNPPYGVGLKAYMDYFNLDSLTERYYKVRWSDELEIFILNNYDGWRENTYDDGAYEHDGVTVGSIQEQWLQTQMTNSTAQFKIVSIHHPPYTSNEWQYAGDWTDARWDFKGMGADAVLSAHWGNYERQIVNNLVYIVNGVGGHRLAGCNTWDPGTQTCLVEYGAILAEINGSFLTFKFYNKNGVLRDSYVVDNTLPVELTSFTASVSVNIVKLKWITETEVNNYGFEIERKTGSKLSTNNKWEKIGFVAGNGNSNSPKYYSFEDKHVLSGKYSYRLKQIDNDGQFEFSSIVEVELDKPLEYSLMQNYPNPFNPSTKIEFYLAEKHNVVLSVYNLLGEVVKNLINEEMEAGPYAINFDGTDLPSGIYIYRLETENYIANRKMSLVK